MMKNFIKSVTVLVTSASMFMTSSLGIVSNINVLGAKSASANEHKKFVQNGISLNANTSGVYGYSYGSPNVSQYTFDPNDSEHDFELIPAGNNANLIKNPKNGKCVNSHQTRIGSTPNFYHCNPNDPDQKFNTNSNVPIHIQSGLKMDLGSGNDRKITMVSAGSEVKPQFVVPLIRAVGSYLVGKGIEEAFEGDEVKWVSLEEDGKSWDEEVLRCRRDAGYLKWNLPSKDSTNLNPISQKTCFKNGK